MFADFETNPRSFLPCFVPNEEKTLAFQQNADVRFMDPRAPGIGAGNDVAKPTAHGKQTFMNVKARYNTYCSRLVT
jgi:hypothetical protein